MTSTWASSCVAVAGVVEEVGGDRPPLLVGGLLRHPGLGVVPGTPRLLEPVQAEVPRRLDHDHELVAPRPRPVCDSTSSGTSHTTIASAGRRLIRRRNSSPDRRMGDRLERRRCLVGREGDRGQRRPVEAAVGAEDARVRTARRAPRAPAGRARRRSRAIGIGVDDDGATLGEELGHRRLPRADSARQAHQQHHGP